MQKLEIKYHLILEFLTYQIYKGSDFFKKHWVYLHIPSMLTKILKVPRLPDCWEVQKEHPTKKKTTSEPRTR